MDVADFIRQCVARQQAMSQNKTQDLRVFVECSKDRRYGFVQIGPLIFIPNTIEEPFNGVTIRSSDQVDGWDEFDETQVKIPSVTEIVVNR